MKTISDHNLEVRKIAGEIRKYIASGDRKKLRFYHGDNHSTRKEDTQNYHWIDISGLNHVIEVNVKSAYAMVEPNVSMERLVSKTLEYGYIPKVIMEFPGITCGGGVNGAALESSSFKYGQFNDTCCEYEIVLGNGEVIKVSEKKYKDIFYGISGSYGSLGLITLIKISLIPSSKYVETSFYPIKTWKETLSFLKKHISKSETDFVEAIVFDRKKGVVITGKLTGSENFPITTYSKAGDFWFYERAKHTLEKNTIITESVPLEDYLFRYNLGAFWMGEYVFPLLHIPNNGITRFLLNPFLNTSKLHDGMAALNIGQRYFVQDFYSPYEGVWDFLDYSDKKLGIYPIWLCPVRPALSEQKLSPHYIKDNILVDIGIWGQSEEYLKDPIKINKDFEGFAGKNNSKKMLYAHSYYTEDEFWDIYDKTWYRKLRKKYKAEGVFPDIWQKVHVSEKYKISRWKGVFRLLAETFQGKHVNA